MTRRVFVAMSGGVDSSVAAALLLEQGYDVTGVTMQLWPSGDHEEGCCSVSAVRDARRVCDLLGIPHYTLNFRDIFDSAVVEPFAEAYARGETPNPCVTCNDRLKFGDLLARVMAQGADFLATGHYARICTAGDGSRRVARGLDADKDQSYFLYRLTRQQMNHILFPLGDLHKRDVRTIATEIGLPVADKAESQEVCFAADGDHASVVLSRRPGAGTPGQIVDRSGNVVGAHRGIAHYTIGQRKGLGIGGLERPLYVVAIDPDANRITVGDRDDLSVTRLEARDVCWHGLEAERVEVAVRYRMAPVAGTATMAGGLLTIMLAEPVLGVATGQSVVCYRDDAVVGGGVISCVS